MRLNLILGTMVMLSLGAVRAADACAVLTADTGNAPVSDHKMMLVMTPQSTTLYDQVRYTGSPSSFAWVLPVKGNVTIGLSADSAFGALDALTASTVEAPAACPIPSSCEPIPVDQTVGSFGDAGASRGGGVDVTQHKVIGPYETVVLSANDSMALSAWLAKNGYAIPPNVQPLFDTYVSEGYDFVAMKLVPNAGVDRMRPVRITTAGAMAQIPLRAVAAGTGDRVGVTMWILSQGYYEPSSFPTFHVSGQEITWDFARGTSNFDAIREQRALALNGLGLEIESETRVNVERARQAISRTGGYAPDGTKQEVEVMAEDLAALLGSFESDGAVHVTRLRGDLSRAALSKDLQLTAAASQSGLAKDRVPAHVINKVCTEECPNGYRKKGSTAGGGGCDASGHASSSWVSAFAILGLALLRRRAALRR